MMKTFLSSLYVLGICLGLSFSTKAHAEAHCPQIPERGITLQDQISKQWVTVSYGNSIYHFILNATRDLPATVFTLFLREQDYQLSPALYQSEKKYLAKCDTHGVLVFFAGIQAFYIDVNVELRSFYLGEEHPKIYATHSLANLFPPSPVQSSPEAFHEDRVLETPPHLQGSGEEADRSRPETATSPIDTKKNHIPKKRKPIPNTAKFKWLGKKTFDNKVYTFPSPKGPAGPGPL